MNPTRGNNSPAWYSTFATTRRAVFQRGLVEKALVPHDGFVTGLPHRARQQFLDVSLQTGSANLRTKFSSSWTYAWSMAIVDENWKVLASLFPADWQQIALRS